MAGMVTSIEGWQVTVRRITPVGEQRTRDQSISLEEAARLAPQWGRAEVRRTHPGVRGDGLPEWLARII